jgi:hypothetical protein
VPLCRYPRPLQPLARRAPLLLRLLAQGQEKRSEDEGDASQDDGPAQELGGGKHDEPLGAERDSLVRADHSGLS